MPFTTSRPFHQIFTNVLKRFSQRNLRPSSTLTNLQPKPITNTLHPSYLQTTQSGFRYALLAGGISFSVALAGIVHATRDNPDFPGAIGALLQEFHERSIVSTDPQELYAYAQSSYSQTPVPKDVVKVVNISRKHLVPIVPYSGGTSLEGNFPCSGSICVDLSGMDKILAINESDADVVCQAGVTWNDLNETLREKGIPLFFPLDPGRDATIGGMISTGCSGTNAVKYGTARGEWILNATVVLPSGEVIKTRQRARKSSAGFDLTKLFIGAEGTLGIVTEATLRLAPLLPTRVAVVQFPDVWRATNAVCDILNRGVAMQCVEIIDELGIKTLNAFGTSDKVWPEKVTLFFKFQGAEDVIRNNSNLTAKVMAQHEASDYRLAENEEEGELIWQDRRNALFAGLAYLPGCKGWITDVCVPVSRLPDLIHAAKKDFEELGLVAPIAGHVGDGNFHALVLYRNEAELVLVREAVSRINRKAIELEGTCTGEHGVGTGKREYLLSELGQGTVSLMRMIKQTIDPHNLFNPGKLYPEPVLASPSSPTVVSSM
ncbi:FAD-linked oxidase-like protein [Pisolithus orientalis]|uniref:FAD-linked oxidase-like protein n=1 Tax=Pisolithus orientalis TaxID=936130 RepID=UPI0022248480|nr:FAD-linked oxidase-like protein [Pisolithus orientalis]KAI6004379.1 FAD-linked oxidase-like protein [Pisolithus orientalis]